MKRLVSMVLSVIMVISLLPLGTLTVSASAFAGGDGSLENPYQISTAEQLNAIRNDLNAHYILVNNIDLSKYDNWTPIPNINKNSSSPKNGFAGSLDGKGYSITNFSINMPEKENNTYHYIGLFGLIESSAEIRNVNFENATINANPPYYNGNGVLAGVGIIGGVSYGSILNCSVNNAIINTLNSSNTGTICGRGATIKDCVVNNAEITVDTGYTGGICGYTNAKITNCHVNGTINISGQLTKYIGGCVGETSKIADSSSQVDISIKWYGDSHSNKLNVGGIAGKAGKIYNCKSGGDISISLKRAFSIFVGGLCGVSTQSIEKSHSVGAINLFRRDDKTYYGPIYYVIGGFLGTTDGGNVILDSCLTQNTISVNVTKGGGTANGFVGTTSSNATIRNCYSVGNTITNQYDQDYGDYISYRITTPSNNINLENNYALDILKLNGNTPTTHIGLDDANGKSANLEQIKEMTKDLFVIEDKPYVMTLAGGYTVMLDEELEINYAVKQGEEYVHNDLDIKWEIESKDSNNAVKIISDKDNAYTRALTIKGINEGECELVAKVDGAELGRTKIEVLGNLADTIEQEVVLRAKILKDNSQYKYYKNNFTDLPEMFTKDMNKTPAVLYNAINDVFKSPTDRTNFYEIVLLDILTDGESTKLLGELGNIVDNKIVQHATKQIGNLDFDTNASSADTTVKKMFDELLDETDDVGKVKVGDVLSGLYTGKKMVNTYIDTVASTYSLGLVSNSQIKVLEDIKNNTTNSNLKEACDNVLDMYYKSSKDGVSYAAQLGMVESGYDGLEFAIGQLIDTVCKLNWVSALYKGAFDVGTTVSNLAYNADDLSAQTLTLIAYAEIGDCLKEAVAKAESNFNSKEDLASASKFMALADTYKVCLLKGCDSSYNLVETTKETEETSKTFETAVFGVLGLAKNAITGLIDLFNDNKDYDHSMKTITNIKKNISVADFYSTEGTDIVEYLREVKSTTPSEWAKPEIEKAKNYGFLPDYMQNNYQNNVTRAEFCTILTWMIEEKTGKSIGQLIEEKGTPIKSPFEDTYYEYADYMCKLGIVNGVSATEFNPLGEITREQAATMLARTAKVLGYDTYSNSNVESSVSSWAKDSVAFVNDKNIMNGTSKGFEPKGKYTKEQAIATFVRMYEKLK